MIQTLLLQIKFGSFFIYSLPIAPSSSFIVKDMAMNASLYVASLLCRAVTVFTLFLQVFCDSLAYVSQNVFVKLI